jgi:hypothetical protein
MQAEILHPTAIAESGVDRPLRILAGLLIALGVVAVIVVIGVDLR